MVCSPLPVYTEIAVSESETNPEAVSQPVAQLTCVKCAWMFRSGI